jgi:hypothetical protein
MYLALGKAVAEGVKQVQYSDKMVTYRSLAEMREILALMRAELYPESPLGSRSRRVGYYSSGK